MTAQSWVETTLPPGYTLIHSWAGRGWVWQTNERQGWNATKAETCRAAWRHWTAAVLRGRGDVRAGDPEEYVQSGGVRWEDDGMGSTTAEVVGVMIARDEESTGADNWVSVFASSDDDYGTHQKVRDDDEAMARFAALVLATQGPVTT